MLQSWQRPLILTHARTDGDALGCMIAMRSILRALGSNPLTLVFDVPSSVYDFLTDDEPLTVLGRDMNRDALSAVDGIVVLDTCAYAQLDPLADWLRTSDLPLIAVDHHVTHDLPTDVLLLDTNASAAALVVYDWARAMDWPLDLTALTALFVGIATDSGWFAFGNADARTLEAAAALTRAGVVPHELYVRIYQSERASKVRLFAAALESLELLDDNRVAVMHVARSAFERCDALPTDTEGIINEPLRIASVDVSVLFVENENGVIRTSFRSKQVANVAVIASSFGGGGHVNAAGARITGTLADVRKRVLEKVVGRVPPATGE